MTEREKMIQLRKRLAEAMTRLEISPQDAAEAEARLTGTAAIGVDGFRKLRALTLSKWRCAAAAAVIADLTGERFD